MQPRGRKVRGDGEAPKETEGREGADAGPQPMGLQGRVKKEIPDEPEQSNKQEPDLGWTLSYKEQGGEATYGQPHTVLAMMGYMGAARREQECPIQALAPRWAPGSG